MEMEEIKSEKFYSLLQAQNALGLKTRQRMVKWIDSGQLIAIHVGEGANKRYAIKGEWIKIFKEKFDAGITESHQYKLSALKLILDRAVKYCIQNNIQTLDELRITLTKM